MRQWLADRLFQLSVWINPPAKEPSLNELLATLERACAAKRPTVTYAPEDLKPIGGGLHRLDLTAEQMSGDVVTVGPKC